MLAVARAIYDHIVLDEMVLGGVPLPLTAAPPAGLGFTVFNRWLKPSGPGSTPTAFDAAQGGRLKRSIVVLDGGEVPHPSPSVRDVRLWDAFPTTHLFAELHDNGKAAIDEAIRRLEYLLGDWTPTLSGNSPISLREDAVLEMGESDEFPGNGVVMVRWRVTGTRQIVAAA